MITPKQLSDERDTISLASSVAWLEMAEADIIQANRNGECTLRFITDEKTPNVDRTYVRKVFEYAGYAISIKLNVFAEMDGVVKNVVVVSW